MFTLKNRRNPREIESRGSRLQRQVQPGRVTDLDTEEKMLQFKFFSPATCFQMRQDLCSAPRANTCCLFFEKVVTGSLGVGWGTGIVMRALPARMPWNVQAEGHGSQQLQAQEAWSKAISPPLISMLHWGPAVTLVLDGNNYPERGRIFQPLLPHRGSAWEGSRWLGPNAEPPNLPVLIYR